MCKKCPAPTPNICAFALIWCISSNTNEKCSSFNLDFGQTGLVTWFVLISLAMEFIKSLKHNQMLLGRVTALYSRASWNSPYHQGIWLRQDYGQYHGNRMPHQPPASLSVPWAALTFASGFARHTVQVRASGKWPLLPLRNLPLLACSKQPDWTPGSILRF